VPVYPGYGRPAPVAGAVAAGAVAGAAAGAVVAASRPPSTTVVVAGTNPGVWAVGQTVTVLHANGRCHLLSMWTGMGTALFLGVPWPVLPTSGQAKPREARMTGVAWGPLALFSPQVLDGLSGARVVVSEFDPTRARGVPRTGLA
jgi:hypothetical protein